VNQDKTGGPEAGPGSAPSTGEMAPGDEAPAGTEGTGEDICPDCGGSGCTDGGDCPGCAGGSGRSSLTLAARREDPGQLRGRIQKNSQPSPTAHLVIGSGSCAILTLVALMGADGKGEEGIDRSFEWTGILTYLGE